MKAQPTTCVIIVAAGKGSRFGATLPKQFCDLRGRPVLMTTIERIRAALPTADILLVINASHEEMWIGMCRQHGFITPRIVYGGATRWASVGNALSQISPSEIQTILVHDGARPLVSPNVVDRLITAINDGAHGAVPCIPVVDSMRRVNADGGSEAVDRTRYRAVQTPQIFRSDMLKKAYEQPYTPRMTDDASVMENAGYNDLRLVEGDPATIKITRPTDLTLVERLIEGIV